MKNFYDTEYAKHKRPYIPNLLQDDIVIFWYAITPTGRFSKYYTFGAEKTNVLTKNL
jgi:hypothetical protein